ncbi:hypothetical protein Tco_0107800, partial [Tanacetum coccineum]
MIPGSYVPTRLQLKVDLGLIEIKNDALPAETTILSAETRLYQQKRGSTSRNDNTTSRNEALPAETRLCQQKRGSKMDDFKKI